MIYKVLRKILFKFDAEFIHNITIKTLSIISSSKIIITLIYKTVNIFLPKTLKTQVANITFPTPIGLAAGLDKTAIALPVWQVFGFGFAELGTVTAQAQPGNPAPRLFRLTAATALMNQMGFNNPGAIEFKKNLIKKSAYNHIPLGVNIGKTKLVSLEQSPIDYQKSASILNEYTDFFIVNVSSPNTPNLRELQEIDRLSAIISNMVQVTNKPIFVKISPDLSDIAIVELAKFLLTQKIAGIVATNTTINKNYLPNSIENQEFSGGISGIPLQNRSFAVLKLLYKTVGENLPIISVGGIFTAEDVWERIAYGASLVEGYTGFIYQGPSWAIGINRKLAKKLKKSKYKSLNEVRGSAYR